MGIIGQVARNLANHTIKSKYDIEILDYSKEYAQAAKLKTLAMKELIQAEQEYEGSLVQIKKIRELIIKSMKAVEYHEKVRKKALDYLKNHREDFGNKFFNQMLFFVGDHSVVECNNAYIKFGKQYLEWTKFMIINFERIDALNEPEITYYNNLANNCETLRRQYNEAYLKKIEIFKNQVGDEDFDKLMKEFNNL